MRDTLLKVVLKAVLKVVLKVALKVVLKAVLKEIPCWRLVLYFERKRSFLVPLQ